MTSMADQFNKLFEDAPLLKPFTEVLMKSIGGSACLVYNVYKSVLTGAGCSIFKSINWKTCSRDPKLKEFGRRVIKANEAIRDITVELVDDLKNILGDHLTQKTYFDKEDAKQYVEGLEEQYNRVGSICDTLIEITGVIDLVSGKNNARFKKQLTNLQTRIEDLESKLASPRTKPKTD